MERICFVILAHNKNDCLRDLVENLRAFAPASTSVLFNGGTDPTLGKNLGIPICPYSRSLGYSWTTTFLLDVMQWIADKGYEYDHLVYVENDMLLIKSGFEEFLQQEMQGFDYMAVQLRKLYSADGWGTAERFLPKWTTIWQPLFQLAVPFGCLNAAQVFSRNTVEAVLAHPRLFEIRNRTASSSIPSLTELLYPCLVASAGCRMKSYPVAQAEAIRWKGHHSLDELLAHREHPHVYLLHPIGMKYDSPDRQFIRAHRTGAILSRDRLQELFSGWPAPVPRRTITRRVLSRLRTLWIRLKRE